MELVNMKFCLLYINDDHWSSVWLSVHVFQCISLFFNVYLAFVLPSLFYPARPIPQSADCEVIEETSLWSVCVCVCAVANTESLSPRYRESDSSAAWQPLLSPWSRHNSGTDLMRCAKSNACFCSVSFLCLSFSSQDSRHPSVFLLPPRSNYLLISSLCLYVLFCYVSTWDIQ